MLLDPDFAFVLDDGHQAVGYVVGTPDTAAFAREYRERWIPRLAGRYPVPPVPPVTPDERMIALHYWPERLLWPGLPEYPAHLHIDLLPDFQAAGHGRRLMAAFCDAVARAGAAGVHVTVVAETSGPSASTAASASGCSTSRIRARSSTSAASCYRSGTGGQPEGHPGASPDTTRTQRYRHKNRRMPVIPAGQRGVPPDQ